MQGKEEDISSDEVDISSDEESQQEQENKQTAHYSLTEEISAILNDNQGNILQVSSLVVLQFFALGVICYQSNPLMHKGSKFVIAPVSLIYFLYGFSFVRNLYILLIVFSSVGIAFMVLELLFKARQALEL